MKVLHIIPGDLWAGAEVQVYYTIRELVRQPEVKVFIILLNKGKLYQQLLLDNITPFLIEEKIFNSIEICREIMKFINENEPCIIHVHEYKCHILANLAIMRSRSKCHVIRTLHGLTVVPFNIYSLKSYIILLLERLFLRFGTECIIAVSKDIETKLRNQYRKVRIIQINNAIEYPIPVALDSFQVREKLGIGRNTFWIGTTARLVAVKNVEMLIDVAKLLKNQQVGEFRVSIFGEGILRGALQRLIDQNSLQNEVILHGFHDDILPILKSFDVFVLTSKHEGMPMSILEVMAVGTVPVCTRVGGMQEIVDDGINGFLVDPHNVESMVEKILFIYKNRSMRVLMGMKGQEKIEQEFSIKQSIKSLLSLYDSLS